MGGRAGRGAGIFERGKSRDGRQGIIIIAEMVKRENEEGLEDTARYAGLLLAPAEGFGRGFFFPFVQKKDVFKLFGPFLAIFCVH